MPDPSKYESEDKFLEACIPIAIEEGKDKDQAVAMCKAMWADKDKKSVKVGARHSITDQASIQKIHDEALFLGSSPPPQP